jgi:ABC-2 type transport system permease protein
MKKYWLVALNEYKRHVLTKRFIFALLSVPMILLVMILVSWITIAAENNNTPLGYVDKAGFLQDPQAVPLLESEKRVEMIKFQTAEDAQQALEDQDIQAYYIIRKDYFQTNQVELVFFEQPGSNATRQFWNFLKINILREKPSEVAFRATQGTDIIIRSLDGDREFSEDNLINILAPLFLGIGILILILISSGYLMNAVVEEKENRTIEILLTSVSPGQLLGGKVIGIIAIALTQIIAWILIAVVIFLVGGQVMGLQAVLELSLDLEVVFSMLVILLLSFTALAALMAAVGATVTESQEAQQVTGLFFLPLWIPYWFAALFIQNPNGPIAIALSLIPFTAPGTFSLRFAFANVPTWQIILSAFILFLSDIVAIWVAAKAFRQGMLRFGKKLRLRELFKPARRGA